MSRDTIEKFLQALYAPGEVREIRAFKNGKPEIFGYFNDPNIATNAILPIINNYEIYITLNPVKEACLCRANNMLKTVWGATTTSDHDISQIKYLLVDCDPVRPAKTSASPEELISAESLSKKIIHEVGTPLLYGMSGNGYHLIYNHEAEDPSQLKEFLVDLDKRFSNEIAKVDVKVWNPSRIGKVLGTMAMKGDSCANLGRIHRKSQLLESNPSTSKTLTFLTKISSPITTTSHNNHELVRRFCAQHSIHIMKEKQHQTGDIFCLQECVFNSSHKNNDSSIIVRPSGQIIYQCFHDHCDGRTWEDVRKLFNDEKIQKCKYCTNLLDWKDGKPYDKNGFPHKCLKSRVAPEESPLEASVEILEDDPYPIKLDTPAPKFPIDAFPQPLRIAAIQISKSIPCPIDYVAVPMLAVCGVAIGNTRVIRIKKHLEGRGLLYTCCVGVPSTGKSPAQDFAMKPVYRIQKNYDSSEKNRRAQWHEKKDKYEANLANWKQNYKAGKVGILRPEEPDEFYQKEIYTTDATLEGIIKTLTGNPRGILIEKDEIVSWIKTFNQYRKGADKEAYLSIWSGKPIKTTRSSKANLMVDKPFVSVIGGTQPDKLKLLHGAEEFNDGFMDRILFSYPEQKFIPDTGYEIENGILEFYAATVENLFDYKFDRDNNPQVVTLSAQAKKAWFDYKEKNRKEAIEGTNFPGLGKMAEQCSRIALIISQVKFTNDGIERWEISENTMSEAIIIAEYFKAHAQRMLWKSGASKEENDALNILDWAKRKEKKIVPIRSIYTNKIAGCRTSQDARMKVEFLLRNKLAEWNDRKKKSIKITAE